MSSAAIDLPEDYEYAVWCSFVEVYNENVHDLLSTDSKPKNLSLKQDHKHSDNKFVAGAATVRLWSETVRELFIVADGRKADVAVNSTLRKYWKEVFLQGIVPLPDRMRPPPARTVYSPFKYSASLADRMLLPLVHLSTCLA